MRRLLRTTAALLLFATLFLFPLLAPPPHRIDEAHFQLITEGMTEAEVEAIFGVRAGSYDWARPKMEFDWLALFDGLDGRPARLGQRRENWMSRHGAYAVWFDERGHVKGKGYGGSTRVEFPWRTWWQKLIRK